MTARQWTIDTYNLSLLTGETPRPITFNEAVTTLQDWMIDGVEVPPDLRPLQFAAWWNEQCGIDGAELSFDCPTTGWLPAIEDIERVLWEA